MSYSISFVGGGMSGADSSAEAFFWTGKTIADLAFRATKQEFGPFGFSELMEMSDLCRTDGNHEGAQILKWAAEEGCTLWIR